MNTAAARSGFSLVPDRPSGPGLTDFALWLRSRGCGETTITDRLEHLDDFARHNPVFPDVSPMHVTAWLGREGFAPWSRATYYGHLKSFFAYAVENDLLPVDPMARMRRPKAPKSTPRPLTSDQVDQVMGVARNANMHAWLTLALYAGLRAHEIAKIRGEDVDQENIFVLGKGGTTAQVPTHPLIWEEAQRRPRAGWWFPARFGDGHVQMRHVSAATGRHFTANGIEGGIHRLRHTYATRLLRSGVNIRVVQELMRHESLNSTMVYTAVSEDERRDGISRLQAYGTPAQPRQLRTAATEARYRSRAAKEARDASAS